MLQELTPPGCLGNCSQLSQKRQGENNGLDAASLFLGGFFFAFLHITTENTLKYSKCNEEDSFEMLHSFSPNTVL